MPDVNRTRRLARAVLEKLPVSRTSIPRRRKAAERPSARSALNPRNTDLPRSSNVSHHLRSRGAGDGTRDRRPRSS